MRVLVAMSGGVDSSVAAALLVDAGHDVVGATMKLWGGAGDSGCCSVADVEDARRVAQQLGISHHVFNFTDDFERDVVDPYVDEHARGRTPNPCIECNRHLKFDRFLQRAERLGFDAIATGHHARVVRAAGGRWELHRGADRAKDQSYVLSMLDQLTLARTLLPVGELTKDDVRRIAASRALRTADKPDSQDVCFVLGTKGGRATFLGARIPLRPGTLIDTSGRRVGEVDAVELVTVGQRRGLGSGGGTRLYALDVDTSAATVVVGSDADLIDGTLVLSRLTWVDEPLVPPAAVLLQVSAHGEPHEAALVGPSTFAWTVPRRRVAPGQTVAIYAGERVVGAGIAEPSAALSRSGAPSPR